jgi:hypothetical protein
MAARAVLAQLQVAEEALAQQRRKQQWVHTVERPSPALTAVLRTPKAQTSFPGCASLAMAT